MRGRECDEQVGFLPLAPAKNDLELCGTILCIKGKLEAVTSEDF